MPSNPSIRRSFRLGLAAAALVTATLAGCAGTTGSQPPIPASSPTTSSTTDSSSPSSPSSTSKPSASAEHNDADVMFAQMMIPHHQQAVEMSDMLLPKAHIDGRTAGLARRIKSSQTAEIATMRRWLVGWGKSPSPSPMGMDHGTGMMSRAEMDALDKASGDHATQLFLTGMIKHHQGGIAMARRELAEGRNPNAKALARRIVRSQTAEIDRMRRQLRGR